MHLLTAEQFTKDFLFQIFELTDLCIMNHHTQKLYNKIVATLFYEPSTRTRLSFESAALRLGANIISTENAKEMSSAIKGESLFDTLRVLEGYADYIVIRHTDNNEIMQVAPKIKTPIINAGAGSGEHPTQALLDAYTISSYFRRLDDLKICVVGDLLFGRTIHSLVKLFSHFDNIEIYGLSPELLHLPHEYVDYIIKNGAKYISCTHMDEVPKDIHVMYCTRTQTERFKEAKEVKEIIINKEVLNHFSEAILMHPLPRNIEISHDVDNHERALYFDQARNGMFVRMALLLFLSLKKEIT